MTLKETSGIIIVITLIFSACQNSINITKTLKEKKSTTLVSKFDSLGKFKFKVTNLENNFYEYEFTFINKSKHHTYYLDTILTLYLNSDCDTHRTNLISMGEYITTLSYPISIIALKPNQKIVKRFIKKSCALDVEKFEFDLTFIEGETRLLDALKKSNHNINQESINMYSFLYATNSTGIGISFHKEEKPLRLIEIY